MFKEAKYITIDEAIRIINQAADRNIVPRKYAEIIIQEIYHETDISKYKKPSYKYDKSPRP